LFETVTWAQTGAHEKPVGLLNVKNYYAPLLAAIDHAVQEGFIFHEHRDVLFCESDPNALLDKMEQYKHPHEAVKRWMREE
jgi:predicted Rossmann-fold nucleotide-binding protein